MRPSKNRSKFDYMKKFRDILFSGCNLSEARGKKRRMRDSCRNKVHDLFVLYSALYFFTVYVRLPCGDYDNFVKAYFTLFFLFFFIKAKQRN